MTSRLLITTAALALTAGLAGTAIAQDRGGAGGREGATPAPPAQQSAPAEKAAPSGTMKRGATERSGSDAIRSQSSQSNGAHAPAATTGQAPSSATDRKVEGEPRNQNRMRGAGDTDNDAKRSQDRNAQQPAAGQNQRSDQRNGTSPSRAGTSGQQNRTGTTGQGAAGARAAVNLSTEQRSTIKTVIHEQKVRPTTLNVSVAVGTRIPHGTHLYPLPARVIEVYPAWRGYEYILVGDEIVVVDPATLEIVAVLEA